MALWIAFGPTMPAVTIPEAVAHGLFAARFGLIAGLLLWTVGSLPRLPLQVAGSSQSTAVAE